MTFAPPPCRIFFTKGTPRRGGGPATWTTDCSIPRSGGVRKWGIPNSWLVFVRENPTYKRMMIWGYTPISGKLHFLGQNNFIGASIVCCGVLTKHGCLMMFQC